MESVLKSILKEELNRNIKKQEVFRNELSKFPKGSIVVEKVNGCDYVYRKFRKGNKIISEYVGPLHGDASYKAYSERERYLQLKKDLKDLVKEGIQLKRMVKLYD